MGEPIASSESSDVRPVVARGAGSNTSLWIFGAILLAGGVTVFMALNERRNALTAPSVMAGPLEQGSRIASAPPLVVPGPPDFGPRQLSARLNVSPPPPPLRRTPVQSSANPARPAPSTAPPVPFIPTLEDLTPSQDLVQEARNLSPPVAQRAESEDGERVRADRLASPAMTIPQGTIIPAVLETALDSTRPGGARALVQRDVHGFDGSRILIPRGSRLYGTYEAGINPGEKRALVQWTRLIRPDGVTIALDSPSSDPLGRAGIEGDVKSRFFARFGSAILQSVLDIGVGVATRRASDGVIVALPGSTQNVTGQQSNQARPVLQVAHGTSVSVFVARDLDFSNVGG